MDTQFTPFMRDLESRYRAATGFLDRTQYKIFYCQVRPAPILALGINPGGSPSDVEPDGMKRKDRKGVASSSTGYFERDEHDVLDCEWKENIGLRNLLMPLVGGRADALRNSVVKTNLAFQRSSNVKGIARSNAISASAPFLSEIIAVVQPTTVILTGPSLDEFNGHFAVDAAIVASAERDPRVRQVVFAATRSRLRATGTDALVVQVAHASQFGWTYARHDIPSRIVRLQAQPIAPVDPPSARR